MPLAFLSIASGIAAGQPLTKPQVANLIGKVENGVDEFRDYLNRRGDAARSADSSPQAQQRRARRGSPTDSQKSTAQAKKDDLDDALGDLNRSTNRLRRKFDATETWIETKVQVEQVMDDARRINQVVARGNYAAEAARLWGVLRSGINDLARAYGLQPLAI
jgi:transcription initiation factor TFIIIB Brf1 subunit/transcription initiation factor TFIIB